MKTLSIDRNKRLRDDPGVGHNRWHPDIEPVIEVDPGESLVIETRDAMDGQIRFGTSSEACEGIDNKVAHPLTGPVFVRGAMPGDLLEIRFRELTPEPHGWTRFRPGAGFLRDFFTAPYLVHWEAENGFARSPQIPGIRIPEGTFLGTAGVAPSHDQLQAWIRREAELVARGGFAFPPDPEHAVPADPRIAHEALRTIPPRENGGNMDIKQLTRGARLLLPVALEGALFSCGDAHYAQGDSECCITAIEIGATAHVEFLLHKGEAARNNIRFPRFAHPGFFAEPQWAAPSNFTATVGMPVREDGTNEGEDLTLAARNALLQMIDLLGERGFTREQAYVICSVAVDLKISNAVDLPNVAVSAFLPEGIFADD
jgi:formamidase